MDVLQTLRANSKWTTDPELIQRRKERASTLARYAPTRYLIEGPVYSGAEDEEDDEDAEAEDDDEETESDADVRRVATDTANADIASAGTAVTPAVAAETMVDDTTKPTADSATELTATARTATADDSAANTTDTSAPRTDPGTS